VPDVESLKRAHSWCRSQGVPWTFFDGGLHTLVHDKGIRGVTLRLGEHFGDIEIIESKVSSVVVRVGAAAELSALVGFALEQALTGVECLAALPGPVGAGLRLNLGHKKRSIGESVSLVAWMESDGRVRRVARKKLEWGYRRTSIPNRAIVLAVELELERGDTEGVAEATAAVAEHRAQHQPDPAELKTCGGLFKNPPKADPAGKLLDEMGFGGLRLHDVRISEKHANFAVNLGSGKAADVLALVDTMKERAKLVRNLVLQAQIGVLGEAPTSSNRAKKTRRGWR